jgi:amino acid transporter
MIEIVQPPIKTAEESENDLECFGYAQELLRETGGFSNFALSFSIISILTGGVLLYGYGLRAGGPYVMTVGWPLVSLFAMCIAASMAEMASAIPTAGAMYHWASFLGGRGVGWVTAWCNLIGQYSITAAIDYGCAEFIAPLLGMHTQNRLHVCFLFGGILLSHALLNHYGVRWVTRLNVVSAWYHIAVVCGLVCVLLFKARLQPWSFLFQQDFVEETFRASTWVPHAPWIWFFMLGLLQAQWTFTGFDASAHISEETRMPRINAPWGIFTSVAVSALAGYVLMLVMTLAVRDLHAVTAVYERSVFIEVIAQALGETWAWVLSALAASAMWFCGLSSLTSNARTVYAFARDKGLPYSHVWSQVSARWKVPVYAIWQAAGVAFILALYSKAFSVIVSMSSMALYVAYGIPLAIKWWHQCRGVWVPSLNGPWALGKASVWVHGVAVLWIACVSVLCVVPPNQQVGYSMLGFAFFLWFYWHVLGEKKRFKGVP